MSQCHNVTIFVFQKDLNIFAACLGKCAKYSGDGDEAANLQNYSFKKPKAKTIGLILSANVL